MRFSFSLAGWDAWAPGIEDARAWESWSAGELGVSENQAMPDLPFVPALFKRRLGMLDRMVLRVGYRFLAGAGPRRLVLGSVRGEICQQYRISADLAREGEVSPAAFSLSVFNAPASLLAIAAANKAPVTTMHSGADTFLDALCLCLAMLDRDPAPLLLICADERLPEEYAALKPSACRAFALALLLAPGCCCDGANFICEPCDLAENEAENEADAALDFLRFVLRNEAAVTIGGARRGLRIGRP